MEGEFRTFENTTSQFARPRNNIGFVSLISTLFIFERLPLPSGLFLLLINGDQRRLPYSVEWPARKPAFLERSARFEIYALLKFAVTFDLS